MREMATRQDGRGDARARLRDLRPSAGVGVHGAAGHVPAVAQGEREGDHGAPCVAVTVPIKTGRGLNAREHWAQRSRRVKSEREAVGWMLLGKRPELPCVVRLTRIAPSKGLDGDNLQGSLKAVRDSVAQWLGVDDADARVTWQYDQQRGEYGVRVEIR